MGKKQFILILSITLSCLFLFCDDLLKSNKQETIITNINMEEMAHRHLPGFSLLRQRAKGDLGTEYVFTNESDSVNVFITVGLHKSANDAENIVLDYLDGISMGMEKGPIPGESIGDKLWWLAPYSDTNIVTNIVFIRKNAHFEMSSHKGVNLKTLAKAIDDDIINEASYITFK